MFWVLAIFSSINWIREQCSENWVSLTIRHSLSHFTALTKPQCKLWTIDSLNEWKELDKREGFERKRGRETTEGTEGSGQWERQEITWWLFNWFKIDNFRIWSLISSHLSVAHLTRLCISGSLRLRNARSAQGIRLVSARISMSDCVTHNFIYAWIYTKRQNRMSFMPYIFAEILVDWEFIADMITGEDRTTWSHWWPNTTTQLNKNQINSTKELKNTSFADILDTNRGIGELRNGRHWVGKEWCERHRTDRSG